MEQMQDIIKNGSSGELIEVMKELKADVNKFEVCLDIRFYSAKIDYLLLLVWCYPFVICRDEWNFRHGQGLG